MAAVVIPSNSIPIDSPVIVYGLNININANNTTQNPNTTLKNATRRRITTAA